MTNGFEWKRWWPAAVVAVVMALLLVMFLTVRAGGKKELEKALGNMAAATSYHTKVNLKLALPVRSPDREQPFRQVEIKLAGDVARDDTGAEFGGRLYAEAKGRGNIFFADGEIFLLSDATAFRLENLPVLLNPTGSLVERWTYVDAALLRVNNNEQILAQLGGLANKAVKGARVEDTQWWLVPVTEEDEPRLIEMMRPGVSGSEAWGVLTRILRAYEVKTLALAVDKRNNSLSQVVMVAGERGEEGEISDKIELIVEFSDFGKDVVIERPEREATAKREVFGRVFGSGELGIE